MTTTINDKVVSTIYMIAAAIIVWFALVLQFYLITIQNPDPGIPVSMAVVNFFSYFTILSNFLVALCFTAPVLFKNSPAGKFFSRNDIRSAITLYITIVGIVYSLVLRNLWDPKGSQLVADILLHDVSPVITILFWFFFVPKGILHLKSIMPWLLFPVIYLVYSLIRGAMTNWYPYPFLNAGELGYSKVLLNSLFITAGFLVVGALIVFFNRMLKRN